MVRASRLAVIAFIAVVVFPGVTSCAVTHNPPTPSPFPTLKTPPQPTLILTPISTDTASKATLDPTPVMGTHNLPQAPTPTATSTLKAPAPNPTKTFTPPLIPTQTPAPPTSTLTPPTITARLNTFTPTLIPSLVPTPLDTASEMDIKLTAMIGSILANPADFADQEVTIVGYYRGWDLLKEVSTGPPVTRSDWVIADSSGAIYVEARNHFDQALGLDPSSGDDTTKILHLVGIVRISNRGQAYIEPKKVELVRP